MDACEKSPPGCDHGGHMAFVTTTVQEQKRQGHIVVGCFPLYPPLELFHSLGLAPVILWDLKSLVHRTDESDRHLQTYSCSVARCLTQLLLADGAPRFDALFQYNACDTLRNLPEIITAGLAGKGRQLPIFRLHIPASSMNPADSAVYLKTRIIALIREMEEHFSVRFSPDKFRESVFRYRKLRQYHRTMESGVARGKIDFGTFSEICCSGRHIPDDAHFERLDSIIESMEEKAPGSSQATAPARVMLSGILPPPAALIRRIESAGLGIVCNDIASLARSYASDSEPSDDPAAYYRELYFRHAPCPTLFSSGDMRIGHLMELVRSRGVDGLIWIGEKYCEYEYFDMPHLEKQLKEHGIPVLQLECGLDDKENIGAFETRIDAFAELLRQHKNRLTP